jgi:hypothetical protein
MSTQPTRRSPRWSVVGMPGPGAPPIAGLPGSRAMVGVGPPKSPSGARSGSIGAAAVPTWLPWVPLQIPVIPDPSPIRLFALPGASAPRRSPPVLPATIASVSVGVSKTYRPPPKLVIPPLIARPERSAEPPLISKTPLDPPPLTVRVFTPGPVIVVVAVSVRISGLPLRAIVCGVSNRLEKRIVSASLPALAWAIAHRSVPALPSSAVLSIVKVESSARPSRTITAGRNRHLQAGFSLPPVRRCFARMRSTLSPPSMRGGTDVIHDPWSGGRGGTK